MTPPNFEYHITNNDGDEFLTIKFATENRDPQTIRDDFPGYENIFALVRADDPSVLDLLDIPGTIANRFDRLSERVTVKGNSIYVDGDPLSNGISEIIMRHFTEGVEDWKPVVAFLEKVQTNVNEHSREQLHGYIERNQISLTDSGDIVFYKGVKKSTDKDGKTVYRPTRTGYGIVDGVEYQNEYLPQYVGSTVEMPRNKVKHDPQATCNVGLHAATFDFAKSFGECNACLEIHVNPRDVVSVPNHGNKIRCCRYVIVSEVEIPKTALIVPAAKAKPKVKKEKTVTVAPTFSGTLNSRKYPKPEAFLEMQGRAKTRKQSFVKYAAKQGPWVFGGGDPLNRKNWNVT